MLVITELISWRRPTKDRYCDVQFKNLVCILYSSGSKSTLVIDFVVRRIPRYLMGSVLTDIPTDIAAAFNRTLSLPVAKAVNLLTFMLETRNPSKHSQCSVKWFWAAICKNHNVIREAKMCEFYLLTSRMVINQWPLSQPPCLTIFTGHN